MGIVVEYNPDLALRNISEFKKGNRKIEECIPENLKVGNVYDFLKNNQRLYWFKGELPLLQTEGNEILSSPIASIIILEATHFPINGEIWTKGKYKVCKILEKNEIYFNGFNKAK
jgi:hypothetical protein